MPVSSSNDSKTSDKATATTLAGIRRASHQRLNLLAAAAAAACPAESTAEALEYYNYIPDPITSDNTVGWTNGTPLLSTFALNLKNGPVNVNRSSRSSSLRKFFDVTIGNNAGGQSFNVATSIGYLKGFDISATIGAAEGFARPGYVGGLLAAR